MYAVWQSMNQLRGYPHGKEDEWSGWIPVGEADLVSLVRRVTDRWKVLYPNL